MYALGFWRVTLFPYNGLKEGVSLNVFQNHQIYHHRTFSCGVILKVLFIRRNVHPRHRIVQACEEVTPEIIRKTLLLHRNKLVTI